MKKLILLALLLSSCSALPESLIVVDNTTPRAVLATQPAPTVTASVIPTATANINATMEVIQQDKVNNNNTAIALQILMIAPTQTAEANQVLIAQANAAQAQANVVVQQIKFDEAAMIYAGNQTQNAFIKSRDETAIPLTQAAYKTNVPLIANAQRMTSEAPRNAQILQAVEYKRKTWWVIPFGAVAFSIGFVMLFVYVFRRDNRPQVVEEETDIPNLDAPYIIPFKAPTPTTRKRIHTDIPCSPSVLLEFADGILHRGMTLAIKQWEGTIVHKRMVNNALRGFMVSNDFAKPLAGQEMDLLDAGKRWLEDVWDLQSPSPPYECIEDDSPAIS